MADIPYSIQRQINRYEAVDFEGLRLFPIRVDNYTEFLIARQAITFVQQSLPVAFMSMPLLQAYYQIDVESVRDERLPTGLFAKSLLFLALSLRIGEEIPMEKRVTMFTLNTDRNDPNRLKSIRFLSQSGEVMEITPIQFQRMRPILAAQNGIELVSDDANPELIAADEFLNAKGKLNLDVSIETLVSSVCAVGNLDEADVYEWPILKLQRREQALKRAIDYIICGIGESQGTKWKGGNPVPHPWFAKVKESMGSLVGLDDFAGGAAKSYVTEAV